MERVAVFIDGFNLYHALKRSRTPIQSKWLDLQKLARCFITTKQQILTTYYFTALAHWDKGKVLRHSAFISALQSLGVEVVHGNFKQVTKRCRNCNLEYRTFEEKQTDVNIALAIFRDAAMDRYDRILLVTGVSDIVPAIEEVKSRYPTKKITLVIPIGGKAKHLASVCDDHMKMKTRHVLSCILPDTVRTPNGIEISCPTEWK